MSGNVYRKRREALAQKLGWGSVVIIPGATLMTRNADVHYPFRQNSNFMYLTGFNEPDALLIITNGDDGPYSTLFCAPKDPKEELWTGERTGIEKACRVFGFDDAYSNTDDGMYKVMDKIEAFISTAHTVYYTIGTSAMLDTFFFVRKEAMGEDKIKDVPALLGEMRLIKDKSEIRTMARAAEISAQAHKAMLSLARPGMYEHELEAALTYHFRKSGGDPLHAYPSIVATGKNACTLHYTKNNARIEDGDLILIDAGCELDGYASDITRTFPANGKWTLEQYILYNLVLTAQKAAIKEARVGAVYNVMHDTASRIITEGLMFLGFIKAKSVEDALAQKLDKVFFPHRTGHWLGRDVHDAGDYEADSKTGRRGRTLEAGMIVTVEPGIYVPHGSNAPKRFWNIGIRIEDDVLITKKGPVVLSASAPKEPDEIEAIMCLRKE